MQVKPVTAGWKGLEAVLNEFGNAINFNDPIEGNGIRIYDTGHGKVIEAVGPQATTPGSPADSGTGGSSGLINGTFQIILNDVKWMDATVVDPTDCSQSSVKILVQSPGDQAQLSAQLIQLS